MTDVLKVLISSLEQWTEEAIASGWLPTGSLQQIDSRHGDTPGTLFDNTERPRGAPDLSRYHRIRTQEHNG